MWDAQIIGQILTGSAAIITAIGGLLLARSRQITADLAVCRSEAAAAQIWKGRAERHMRILERGLSQAGLLVPDRPDELL